jgi:hypothetical protein
MMVASCCNNSMQLPTLTLLNSFYLASPPQTAPELAKLLGVIVPEDPGLGPAPVRATSASAFGAKSTSGFKNANASPRNIRSAGHTMDTPRSLEEELTEEQLLQLELEEVKRERNVLTQSIAQVWRAHHICSRHIHSSIRRIRQHSTVAVCIERHALDASCAKAWHSALFRRSKRLAQLGARPSRQTSGS